MTNQILLYMLFIIVRFQPWSFIRTQISIFRCRRPVAIFFTLFAAATLKSINTTRKKKDKKKKPRCARLAYCDGHACLKNHCWTVRNLVQREYAVYSRGRPSQRYTLSLQNFPYLLFSLLPYLYYYE
ncbi:hypothetical protein M441DRAFT_294016 [Trichoderma asperellum CBS 433.97]|uniref:Uncharacterized protein n=1 Tax=Trichoderma asperellum (strain ATCC 204424 / CBS 433.97 / NBRC 101777) TaxID=1042311 RepID=A0A2T3YTE6_TRIA4|nr:hypothetical protein M441DRAFT_294016 [Trichoderma asperellum CBS 433.97]PTB35807.1 hypothetical protein M441DRAFT_294016 [Trichoderma asperellum CBS 433.97]